MIQINPTLIIQLVNFLVLLYLLNILLYKPIMAKMKEREELIRKDQERAAGLQHEVESHEKKHEEELAKAKQIAAQEKATLVAEAKKKEAEILDEARAEAGRIVDNMRATIQSEAAEARKTLEAEMTPLARSISEKILGRSL